MPIPLSETLMPKKGYPLQKTLMPIPANWSDDDGEDDDGDADERQLEIRNAINKGLGVEVTEEEINQLGATPEKDHDE